MLTISQLAAYAAVTVRAVRHYHQIGLLPEPERDHSGYRRYDAGAVVRLIRIHTLADAGVPLARVQELLDADAMDFAHGVAMIDKQLRAEIQRLQGNRKRIAGLAAGEYLALPISVVGYLDRLRGMGVEEGYIEMERDAWIMVAAQTPQQIDAIIAGKHIDLDNPDLVRLYSLLSGVLDWSPDDQQAIEEVADILDRVWTRALESGELNRADLDDQFVGLLDTTMADSAPAAQQLLLLLAERGWTGWTNVERVHDKPRM